MDKLQIFKNSEFGELGVMKIEGREYFPASDCARILGYKDPFDAIARHTKGSVKKTIKTNGGFQEVNFIGLDDLFTLIQKSRILSMKEKSDIIARFNLENYIVIESRNEIEFGEMLETLLNGFCEIHKQYKVLDYKIDFYLPEFNLAIEYDEFHHDFQAMEDKFRQTEIENELNCNFIRVKNSNELKGINKILKYIYKKQIKDVV